MARDQMERLARNVAALDVTGRVPEHLIEPLLRNQALAAHIVKHLDAPRRFSASGVPIIRRKV